VDSSLSNVSTAETGPSRKRQVLLGMLTIAALAVVFFGVLPQFADYRDALSAARGLPALWLIALGGATLLSVGVYGLQWRAPLPELTFPASFRIANTSFMVSNGIPGGGALVLPTQYAMLADEGVRRARATAATGVTALWNVLATLLVPLVGVCFLVGTGDNTPTWWWTIIGGVAGFTIVGLLLRALVRSGEVARSVGERAERVANRVLQIFHRDRPLHWGDALVSFRESTHELLSARWAQISIAQVGVQLSQFAVLEVALAAVQRDSATSTSFATALFAFGVSRLGTFIPISPGGLGTVDGVLAALLVSAGNASATDALAAVLIWRALTFLPGMALGSASFVAWRKRSAAKLAATVPTTDGPAKSTS
jgi:uncharacterized membrane protein YbhN (UPF0104 family)